MNQGDDYTINMLRSLKEKGDIASQLAQNKNIGRELLRTPPTSSLSAGNNTAAAIDELGLGGDSMAPLLNFEGNEMTVDLVKMLQQDCDAFQKQLVDATRLAKEQMQRSLLQLFEDTTRDKLADVIARQKGTQRSSAAAVTTTSVVSANRPVSKRPVDRGLDKRDAPSEVVIPDAIRYQISQDIYTVVDHELKRCFGIIGTDITRIVEQVQNVKNRMCKMEEELLQREIDTKMQADQLASSAQLITDLQEQITTLTHYEKEKDAQMDLLRDQVARRNQALDETRVRFRKEVQRIKRITRELEGELEAVGARKKGFERKLSVSDIGEDDMQGDSIQTEQAIKEISEKFHEQIRQMQVSHAKEIKALKAEMNMKLSEREQDILRLRQKLHALQQKGQEE